MKKTVLILGIAILVVAVFLIFIRFITGEDVWLCQDGQWVKHGQPNAAKPTTICPGAENTNTVSVNINQPANQNKNSAATGGNQDVYSWSTSDQGPYKDKISYATSTDLLHWTDSGKTLAEHASVPGAVIKDGVIYVYFVDVSQDGVPERLALLRSQDNGQTWQDKQIITINGLGDKVPVDPAPFFTEDGRIRLYYFDINAGRSSGNFDTPNKIHSAVSTDGLNFTEEAGMRYQEKGIFDPDVEKEGNVYRLYVGSIEQNEVISAVSTDGLTFTREGVAYQGGAVPDVISANSQYYLFTAGINIATSTDGKTFTATGSGFQAKTGMITADPSVIRLVNGSYLMFYKYK